jgi:MYXO-CTERM domain-containing protein
MMPKMRLLHLKAFTFLVFAMALFATLTFTRKAAAYHLGIDNVSPTVGCSAGGTCHTGSGSGWTNTSGFGSPSGGGVVNVGGTWYVDPNGTVSLSWTTSATRSTVKGFNVSNNAASAVTFKTTSANAHITPSNTITHNDRNGPGDVTFFFTFQAPSTACSDIELRGWGNTIDDPAFDSSKYTNNIAKGASIFFKTKCGNGTGCSTGFTCASGNCVDGNCCNTGCGGQCEQCSGGTCSFTSGLTRSGAACGGTGACAGSCSGASSCSFPGTSTICLPAKCDSGTNTATTAGFCNTSHTCGSTTSASCAPYTCNSSLTACGSGCGVDTDCVAGNYCSAGACKLKEVNGTACTGANMCQSGFCVDGVCCNTLCNGQCSTCVGPTKGTCSAVTGVPTGGRPACATDGISTCGGACDGVSLGACAYPTTECRPAFCGGSVATLPANCDGKGSCPVATTKVCAPYSCAGNSCATTCVGDGDCAPSSYCDATGTCTPKNTVGNGCIAGKECSSGLCVDGVCCDRACDGQCEACDVGGKVGTCVNVTDPPHNKRPACAAGPDGCPMACDGTNALTCSPATCDAGADATPEVGDDTGVTGDAADETGGDAGDETGGDAGDETGPGGDATMTDASADGGNGDLNENANCACRTTGRSRAPYGFALFGLGLGAFVLRQRRRRAVET